MVVGTPTARANAQTHPLIPLTILQPSTAHTVPTARHKLPCRGSQHRAGEWACMYVVPYSPAPEHAATVDIQDDTQEDPKGMQRA